MEKSYESMTNKKPNYVKNIVYNIRLEGNLTKMGLSLNNIYQRPYVKPDRQSTVKNVKKMKNLLPPMPNVNKSQIKTLKARDYNTLSKKQLLNTPQPMNKSLTWHQVHTAT